MASAPVKDLERVPLSTDACDQTESPLLQLPGELRNKIYEYALCNQTWGLDIVDGCPVEDPELKDLQNAQHFSNSCRQTRFETYLWAFQRSTFYIKDDKYPGNKLGSFTAVQKGAITRVQLWASLTVRTSPRGDVRMWNITGADAVKALPGLKHVVIDMRITTERWDEGDPGPTEAEVQSAMKSIEGGVRFRVPKVEVSTIHTFRDGGVIPDREEYD